MNSIYTVDSYGRYRFLAHMEAADAELLRLLGQAVRDAESLEDAGAQILALAEAKKANVARLGEMAEEQKNAPEGTSDVR